MAVTLLLCDMEKIENRAYKSTATYEERAEGDTVKGVFVGYPIRFNEWSVDLGGFKEMIANRAWDTADTSECLAVFNHEEEALLGTADAGTLRFYVDNDGVKTEIDKANTTISRDCSEWVKRGEIKGQSFKFVVMEDEWIYNEGEDILQRVITSLGKVYDTSLVTRPAYPTTSVEGRGVDVAEIRNKLIAKKEEMQESTPDDSVFRFYDLINKTRQRQ